MYFVVQHDGFIPRINNDVSPEDYPLVVIVRDGWNDYSYQTMCSLHVYLRPEGQAITLGNCRIMYKDQEKWHWGLENYNHGFNKLPSNFCSLGIETSFYEKINIHLGVDNGIEFLESLRDAAWLPQVWRRFENDTCFRASLMRDKSEATKTRDVVPTLFGKKNQKKVFRFVYSVALPGAQNLIQVPFDFRRTSFLPHRIALLVGRNGAGKTQILSNLAIALTGVMSNHDDNSDLSLNKLLAAGQVKPTPSIYRVVAVSFNAFDSFEILPENEDGDIKYSYCGIRMPNGTILSADDQISKIVFAVGALDDEKHELLIQLINGTLDLQISGKEELTEGFYKKLSAGQRIVVNIISHVMARIEIGSLLLIDEPETHLHPQLATSLISALADLLTKFKSFAVIATHSPLIAQQVPSSMVTVVDRNNGCVEVFMPDIECFGENLSEISSALYETKEYERDYKVTLDTEIRKCMTNQPRFENLTKIKMGANARAYVLAKTWELTR